MIQGLPVIHVSGDSEEASAISRKIDIFNKFKVQEIRASLKLADYEINVSLTEFMSVPHRTYLLIYSPWP